MQGIEYTVQIGLRLLKQDNFGVSDIGIKLFFNEDELKQKDIEGYLQRQQEKETDRRRGSDQKHMFSKYNFDTILK